MKSFLSSHLWFLHSPVASKGMLSGLPNAQNVESNFPIWRKINSLRLRKRKIETVLEVRQVNKRIAQLPFLSIFVL
jgi:hypothetical protein